MLGSHQQKHKSLLIALMNVVNSLLIMELVIERLMKKQRVFLIISLIL